MSLEIARLLIAGKWKTALADSGNQPGGGIPQGGPLTQDLAAGGYGIAGLGATDMQDDLDLGSNDLQNVQNINGPSGESINFSTQVGISPAPTGQATLNSGDGSHSVTAANTGLLLFATALGFFHTTPVAQPVVPLTAPTVQNIIDALVSLGLVAQHD